MKNILLYRSRGGYTLQFNRAAIDLTAEEFDVLAKTIELQRQSDLSKNENDENRED